MYLKLEYTFIPSGDTPEKRKQSLQDELERIIVTGNNLTPNLLHIDTSGITDMSNLFYKEKSRANIFKDHNSIISGWDISNVTNMNRIFRGNIEFNNDISKWLSKPNKVTNMERMFFNAEKFNQNISNWNTSKVTEMSGLFYEADIFNQDISNWNVSKVTNMGAMFNYATAFDQDISNWQTDQVTECSNFSRSSPINGTAKEPSFKNCSN